MEALRAEALQQIITRVEDRNFGGLRNQVHWSAGFRKSRLILLCIAIVAGSLAAYLAVQRPSAPVDLEAPPVTEIIVQEPRVQVLAARSAVAVGERLTADAFEWVDWPESAVHADYITATRAPEAATRMSGSTARAEFLPGEPIRTQKLMAPGEGSYLSAVLGNGMRGVSVAVSADSASGGFVAPADRVDVVLTRPTANGQTAQTILTNVRVLAIDTRLGPGAAPKEEGAEDDEPAVFKGSAIATLELDATGAEVIMTATAYGHLSLVLRSMTDAATAPSPFASPANQAIRLSSPFWTH